MIIIWSGFEGLIDYKETLALQPGEHSPEDLGFSQTLLPDLELLPLSEPGSPQPCNGLEELRRALSRAPPLCRSHF